MSRLLEYRGHSAFEVFRMNDLATRMSDLILKSCIKEGVIHKQSVTVTVASGRKFTYEMHDYPFKVEATDLELDALACQVIKDKYKYCQWDREHPKTNQEVEIFDAIKAWMLFTIARAKQLVVEPVK